MFNRPAGGWSSQQPQEQELFAGDGRGGDLLGRANVLGWNTLAAPEDGSFIDAPMSPFNLSTGAYPHDRIGYEFDGPQSLTVPKSGTGSGTITSSQSFGAMNLIG